VFSVDKGNSSYIEDNYAYWLISGGNDVVPILPWMNDTEIDNIISISNGLLIPGNEKK